MKRKKREAHRTQPLSSLPLPTAAALLSLPLPLAPNASSSSSPSPSPGDAPPPTVSSPPPSPCSATGLHPLLLTSHPIPRWPCFRIEQGMPRRSQIRGCSSSRPTDTSSTMKDSRALGSALARPTAAGTELLRAPRPGERLRLRRPRPCLLHTPVVARRGRRSLLPPPYFTEREGRRLVCIFSGNHAAVRSDAAPPREDWTGQGWARLGWGATPILAMPWRFFKIMTWCSIVVTSSFQLDKYIVILLYSYARLVHKDSKDRHRDGRCTKWPPPPPQDQTCLLRMCSTCCIGAVHGLVHKDSKHRHRNGRCLKWMRRPRPNPPPVHLLACCTVATHGSSSRLTARSDGSHICASAAEGDRDGGLPGSGERLRHPRPSLLHTRAGRGGGGGRCFLRHLPPREEVASMLLHGQRRGRAVGRRSSAPGQGWVRLGWGATLILTTPWSFFKLCMAGWFTTATSTVTVTEDARSGRFCPRPTCLLQCFLRTCSACCTNHDLMFYCGHFFSLTREIYCYSPL
ncbi:uncharacterized protein [Triticum aestivum]|uniref:uncharacterized protein isoform X2 n=1 Tax=Triticum aestivum TaxID=4565 RepID=UPI001D01D24D|nr:uncharacterized protein LOC123139161 isoform X2 [Triticum aestivum]